MNESTFAYLKDLSKQRFWGTITVKFEGGAVVHVRQEQNFKPSELSGQPRRSDASANGS